MKTAEFLGNTEKKLLESPQAWKSSRIYNVQWSEIEMQRILYQHYINGIALSQDYIP